MNSIIKYLFVLIVFLSLDSCKKLPHYSKTPEISFKKFDIYRNVYNAGDGVFADSVSVVLHFQDGDGDLGLDEDDKKNDTLPNFFMKVQPKDTSHKDTITYYGQFQPLTYLPKSIKGPVDGDLIYSVYFNYNNFIYTNDTLTFLIHIKDRAGNISNTVQTDPLVVHQP